MFNFIIGFITGVFSPALLLLFVFAFQCFYHKFISQDYSDWKNNEGKYAQYARRNTEG